MKRLKRKSSSFPYMKKEFKGEFVERILKAQDGTFIPVKNFSERYQDRKLRRK